MECKLKCSICRKVFYGNKNRLYCGRDCNLKARRKRRLKNDKEKIRETERKKEVNKKYYLKNKYVLTKKYKEEQKKKEKRKKEYSKIWKSSNKVKAAEYRRKTRIKTRGWFDDYKNTLKCEICGYNKCSEALDFHHKDLNKKEFNIGQAINKWGKEKILEEIKKCICICANCHRELHYNEKQEKKKERREAYLKIINEPKKIYYNVVEEELEKDWFKELQDKAKYNLNRFGGNQYTKIDNGIKEKIDTKKILAKKIGIGEGSVKRILQVYKRGTEDQKQRVRTGESSINKVYKELEPIRYS
ncbi:MAG TPA: hypothetical protein VMZ91_03930 [Candidatus Paceibacterota bacterium]|nr:hypothetical protein [Candidatus Paceibacterota bacterium]